MNAPVVFRAMNTDFLVDGMSAENAAEVQRQVERAEATFSRFSPDSEISRINRTPGTWVQVSAITYDLLTDAVAGYQATKGLFNPFMGLNMKKMGYDRSFELLQPERFAIADGALSLLPANTTQTDSVLLSGILPLEMDLQQQAVRLARDFSIDVGGIAKGWMAQRAAETLMVSGVHNGLIDAGGDIVLWGQEPEQGLWGIGVANPKQTGHDIADLWMEGLTAMATSSVAKRRWTAPGRGIAHHILDPRTGVPAVSDLLQVTVIGRDLAVTEQYAKFLMVLGSAAGFSCLAKQRPELAYIGILKDGTICASANLDLYLKEWEVKKHVNCLEPYS
jgi:thiamine biosynthesis lipoprotein